MVLSVRHRGDNGGYLAGDESDASYENDFEALPFDVPFRPARVTPWPRVAGTQVGIVTGPPGEEIFPDKFGRVQVAFRFDDEYEHDTKHSCWVRMAQVFAGPKFGSVFLPRIGHEVLVDFLDGNPDNPVIVGQLYSDKNLPPWTLPDNKTQSGFKTKSSSKGGTDDFNELRFEDKKGEEQIFMQAQKDLDVEVKNNETRKVKQDRTTTIEEGNETQTVAKGDETLEITKGSQTLTIGKDQTVKIDGKQTVTIKGEQKITVTGKISIESKQEILLKVGSNSIKIDNTGITIKGTMVKIEGSATAEMKSPMTTVKGDGMLTLKGGMTMIN
jgi:type VI secretion system secreted protein VgrG